MLAALAAVLAVATAVRLVGHDLVFEGGTVRFRPDGDALYHAMRARHLAATGSVLWFDPALNPPRGATVLWPPLLEGLIAGAAYVGTGGHPTPADVDRVAAFLPVLLGVLAVAALGALAVEILGPGHGLLAASTLALSPAAAFYATVGRPDQHVLEQLLFVVASFTLLRAARAQQPAGRRAWWTIALGASLALSFWAWQGSALTLLVLAAAAACEHVFAPPDGTSTGRLSGALATGAAVGALLLAGSTLLFGPPGALASGRIEGVSGLGPALCAATALGAALLTLAGRRSASRAARAAEAAGAAILAAAGVLAVPALRGGIHHGILPIGTANPWYSVISEFQPVLFGGRTAPSADLRALFFVHGLLPVLALCGAAFLPEVARAAPERRSGLVLLGASAAVLTPLWLARSRFDVYELVPLAILGAAAARGLAQRLPFARSTVARGAAACGILAAALAPFAFEYGELAAEHDPGFAPVARIAERLGAAISRGDAAPGVVLCTWGRGHHVRTGSGLPALVTPFGSDAGADAMDDWAAFLLATTEQESDAVLDRRGVRWLLLEPLETDLLLAQRLRPPGSAPVRAHEWSPYVEVLRPAAQLVSARLYWADGNGSDDAPALDELRLVDEDFAPSAPLGLAKLFERVAGAALRVAGVASGGTVVATVELVSPVGRSTSLTLKATADARGDASLRLPYATGWNGRVRAGPWTVGCGDRRRELAVSPAAVTAGVAVQLSLR